MPRTLCYAKYDEVITHITSILESSHKESAGRAVGQWMYSPRHRDALVPRTLLSMTKVLDPDLKTFGIGVQECSSNIIFFDGKPHEMINNTYFTVIFDY